LSLQINLWVLQLLEYLWGAVAHTSFQNENAPTVVLQLLEYLWGSKTRQVAIFQADTAGKFSDSDKLWWKDKG